jgi:hypothetical protein
MYWSFVDQKYFIDFLRITLKSQVLATHLYKKRCKYFYLPLYQWEIVWIYFEFWVGSTKTTRIMENFNLANFSTEKKTWTSKVMPHKSFSLFLHDVNNTSAGSVFLNCTIWEYHKSRSSWLVEGTSELAFPSTCMLVKCMFAVIPSPTLLCSCIASMTLISSADRKFIPSSRTWIGALEWCKLLLTVNKDSDQTTVVPTKWSSSDVSGRTLMEVNIGGFLPM